MPKETKTYENTAEQNIYTFKHKWSPAIERLGFTSVPNILLDNLAALNVTAAEFLTLVAVFSFKWDNRDPWPSNATISKRANCSPETVRSHIRQLEKKRLLKRIPRTGSSNCYDFTGLVARLEELAETTTHVSSKSPHAPDGIHQARSIQSTTKEDALNKDTLTRRSDKLTASNDATDLEQVRLVYGHYLKQFGNDPSRYKLTASRKTKIKARLKDAGYEMLIQAIDNTAANNFYRGENERGWKADLDFITRSYEKTERLSQLGGTEIVFKADW